MAPRARRLTLLLFLVAALLGALPALAQASPDGDDDPTYNAGSAFGTQYSLIDGTTTSLDQARPVTDQDTDGSSVTAAVVSDFEVGGQSIRLTRFNINGQPTGFGGDGTSDGISVQAIPANDSIDELLDIRILSDGTFWVLARGIRQSFNEGQGDALLRYHFNAAGLLQNDDVASKLPVPCQPVFDIGTSIQAVTQYTGGLVAARVKANGDVAALWDCIPQNDYRAAVYCEDNRVFVTSYGPTDVVETAARELPETVSYGNDLELGPTGDPYALVGICPQVIPLVGVGGSSQVFHVNADATLTLADPAGGSEELDGLPVDLAVDSQARPVVWTEDVNPALPPDGNNHWIVWRLKALDLTLDTVWGDNGKATITDPRLAFATGGGAVQDEVKVNFLTVRAGDKVLATGRNDDGSTNGIIAGLTNLGDTDTGFATSGFKEFEYSATNEFLRIGEPTLQSDGKVLVPHTSGFGFGDRQALRIAPPPSDDQYVGVTRLVGPPGGGGGGGGPPPPDDEPSNPDLGSTPPNPIIEPPSLVTPSSTAPAICGRRAISLVRADVRRNTVKLTGLVGSALFGKQVTIQTDPKGARSSAFTTTTTVTASSTGAFSAIVRRPKRSDFISVRYRARSGSAISKSLKLPQRLTSRMVSSARNTITVEGRVKKSVLGRRNNVIIRRLICGRYRRVGSARPDRDGNYTVTFPLTRTSDEVAFYRAEARVLRKPGSRVYVIQYARALVIRTTGQTG